MTPPRRRSPTTAAPWWLGLAVLLCALVVAVPVHAASPDASADGDRLTITLLGQDDLPGFVGTDLEDPTELDIDRLAFDQHRGIRVTGRAWASQEQGVVFDQRMLFPTDETALGYLVAAEATLSEADDAGLALVADDPLTPATRHWAGETVIGGEPVAMDVWLIPVGPVVAKVAATVFGPGLELRRSIAERALGRLVTAHGPADAVWPTGSAAPSASAVSELRIVERLGQQVLRTGQRGCEGIDPGLAGEVTALSCARGDAVIVYRAFVDTAARDAAYASLLEQVAQPMTTSGTCDEAGHRIEVTEGDRRWALACWDTSSGRVLLWTEPEDPVLGAILATGSEDLMTLWEDARFVE